MQKRQEKWDRYQNKTKMLDAPKDHKFWNTQPVPALSEEIAAGQNCPIDAETDVSKVRQVQHAKKTLYLFKLAFIILISIYIAYLYCLYWLECV